MRQYKHNLHKAMIFNQWKKKEEEEGFVVGSEGWEGILRFGCDHSFVFADGVQPFSPVR